MTDEYNPNPSEWVVLPEHLHQEEEEEEDDNDDDHSNNTSEGDDDDDDDMLVPPPPTTSGDNPAMITQRPSSRSRHSTPTAADTLLNRPSALSSPPLSRSTTPTSSSRPPPTTPNERRSITPLSYEALSNRPRSNPRVRTPMRYESPLTSSAFHRSRVQEEEEVVVERRRVTTSQRVTIRSNAGMAVGSLGSQRFGQNTNNTLESSQPSSSQNYQIQQQPPYHSHRKMRRWNNDKMVGISSDLAKYAKRWNNAAEVFTRGEAESFKFRVANYPVEYRSAFARLAASNDTGDPSLIQVREKFIRGEVAEGNCVAHNTDKNAAQDKKRKKKEIYSDGNKMYQQIDIRLRKVLSRALLSKSKNADQVICAFESFLTSLKADEKMSTGDDFEVRRKKEEDAMLEEVLLRPPAVSWKDSTHHHHHRKDDNGEDEEESHHKSKKTLIAQFVFDAKSSSQGGFHRLLLHAVCQFHGLNAQSTTTTVSEGGGRRNSSCKARVLTVTGRCHGRKFRLVDYALQQHDDGEAGNRSSTAGANDIPNEEAAPAPPEEACSRVCSVESQCDESSLMSEGVLVGHMSNLDVS